MAVESSSLPELNLRGMRIWLSGAVPESESESPDTGLAVEVWGGSSLEHGILGFVQEFSSLVFKYGGEIVHGSHPTLTPILLEQSRQFSSGEDRQLHLVVSNYFESPENDADWERWKRDASVEILDRTGDDDEHRDSSLAALRAHIATNCDAFVAIGGLWWHEVPGRAGIPLEFELAKQAEVPCFVLGGFGGASATYIQNNPEWHCNLRNGLTTSQNGALAANTNFNLVAGRLAAQLHLLNENHADGNDLMMAD